MNSQVLVIARGFVKRKKESTNLTRYMFPFEMTKSINVHIELTIRHSV